MPASQTLARSCAECKRLKLKCDRTVPCNSCVRRGCPQICPDGTLVAGKGSRFILSNTKELHEEVEALRARVKQLEGALAELQARLTPEPHPLLQKSFNMVSTTLGPAEPQSGAEAEDESLIDTFGRLNLEPNGQTIWYGPHAGSRFYMPGDNLQEDATTALPVDLMILSRMFPLGAATTSEAEELIRQEILNYIPSEEDATELVYSHQKNLNWSSEEKPQNWPRFRENILKPVYSPDSRPKDAQLAIFFLELAISSILDPRQPPNYAEADKYHNLSKICISLGRDILTSSTPEVIHYLQLLAYYYGFTNDANGHNKAWITGTLAIRLAQMGGLHRENPKWNLDSETIENRRGTWWNLVAFDTIRALELGRPRAVNVDQFDTKMPHDPEDDGKGPTFDRIRYRYMTTALGAILDEAFRVKPPSYSRTLQLDKEIRNWPLQEQPILEISMPRPEEIDQKLIGRLMRSFATTGVREIALAYLHRRYFIEALTRYPQEPLRSKYAMSVIAVYRSSILLLQALRKVESMVGALLPRVFTMGQHTLSVYVCLCAIVINSPACSLARSCLAEIDAGKEVLLRISAYGIPYAPSVVTNLYQQAHRSMELYRKGQWSSTVVAASNQEVMTFAGRPGLFSTKERAKKDKTATSTPDSNAPESISNIAHPLLIEYLMHFQGSHDTVNRPQDPTVTAEFPSFGPPDDHGTVPPLASNDQWSIGQAPAAELSFELLNAAAELSGESMANPSQARFQRSDLHLAGIELENTLANTPTWPYSNYDISTTSSSQQSPGDNLWQTFLNDLDMPFVGGDGRG